MERVALYLQKKAISAKDSQADLNFFGRSAFNRYYYSMYLLVKDMLTGMSQGWVDVPHKSIPELLKGTIVDRLKRAGKQATRVGDNDGNQLCIRGTNASIELADLMKQGYAFRVVADYYPGIKIILSGKDRFTLNSVSINDAHDWPIRTKLFTPLILRAWKLTSE